MKTASLLHEVFQFDPQSLIQLLQLKLEGRYAFESITIKTTEKRLDGFFKRIDSEGRHLFLKALPQWKVDIQSLQLPEAKEKRLVELFEYAITQRFPELTEEEVSAMSQLTPLDQTIAGKQIFARGYAIAQRLSELTEEEADVML